MSKKESKSKLTSVIANDKFNACPKGESMNLWGVPFTFDGKNMVAEISAADAKIMKAAGRIK